MYNECKRELRLILTKIDIIKIIKGEKMKVEIQDEWYSINECKKFPNKLYVFGDNTLRVGNGGKPIVLNSNGKISIKIDENVLLKIKHIATINGIKLNDKGSLLYPETSATGKLTSLNWHGSLDIQDDEQFNQALTYAATEKNKN